MNSKRMKGKAIYIIPGLFALVFIVMILIGNLNIGRPCEDKKEFIESAYNAIVIKKYLDKENHNYKTIIYSNENKVVTMRLFDDTSRCYEFVKPGDSLHKKKNSEYINVNNIEKFRIYFECK